MAWTSFFDKYDVCHIVGSTVYDFIFVNSCFMASYLARYIKIKRYFVVLICDGLASFLMIVITSKGSLEALSNFNLLLTYTFIIPILILPFKLAICDHRAKKAKQHNQIRANI